MILSNYRRLPLQRNQNRVSSALNRVKPISSKVSSTASKLNIPLKETPQTVNVLTRQQLDDFALDNTRTYCAIPLALSSAIRKRNGPPTLPGGFEISNVLVDGVGIPLEGYNYNNDNPDSFLFDRIEVVKGANALNNGIGDPGATINMIRKRPTSRPSNSL